MGAITHSEDWWADPRYHAVRCAGHYKSTGGRCRTEAIPGSSVCEKHGGLAPQVIRAAQTRIAMSADDAARRLIEWLHDPDVDMRERVKIAESMLDRSGLKAVDKVLVGVTDDPVETLFRDLLADPNGLEPALPASDGSADEYTPTDLIGLPAGAQEPEDIVDAEVVEEHTVAVTESMSDRPPEHLREPLERSYEQQLRVLI